MVRGFQYIVICTLAKKNILGEDGIINWVENEKDRKRVITESSLPTLQTV